jgi:hypothetical protein
MAVTSDHPGLIKCQSKESSPELSLLLMNLHVIGGHSKRHITVGKEAVRKVFLDMISLAAVANQKYRQYHKKNICSRCATELANHGKSTQDQLMIARRSAGRIVSSARAKAWMVLRANPHPRFSSSEPFREQESTFTA